MLSITVGDSFLAEVRIRRIGDRIDVYEPQRAKRPPCGGTPTVANTDRVDVSVKETGAALIELGGGPFAPGATPEANGFSEIEFRLSGYGDSSIVGGPTADLFQYRTTDEVSGIDLDPGPEDDDVDVDLPDQSDGSGLTVVEGGPGPDTVEVVGHPPVDVFARGGSGDDTLLASTAATEFFGVSLDGEAGRDRIVGSSGPDLLSGGRGQDTIDGLAGGDLIALNDRGRDTVDCGTGHDAVVRPNPFDRLRSCERTK